jgi:hypothetical protein
MAAGGGTGRATFMGLVCCVWDDEGLLEMVILLRGCRLLSKVRVPRFVRLVPPFNEHRQANIAFGPSVFAGIFILMITVIGALNG